MKLEVGTALTFVILHHFVIAHDYNHLSKCPEYNPQNELDIDLVRMGSSFEESSNVIKNYLLIIFIITAVNNKFSSLLHTQCEESGQKKFFHVHKKRPIEG
jgi:hypothetical protein